MITSQSSTSPKTLTKPYLFILTSTLIYCVIREPLLTSLLIGTALPLIALKQTTKTVAWLRPYGLTLTYWNISTLVIAFSLVFGLFHAPASAFFLSGLEDFFTTLVQGAQTGSGSTIDPTSIALFFNFIRGIFVISVVGAVIFAYNQSQNNQDWRLILNNICIAFAVVIAVDIITYVFTS